MHFHRIAGQFFNRPLLLTPASADTISNFLLSRMAAGGPAAGGGIGGIEHDAGESLQIFSGQERGDGSREVHSPRASRFYGEVPTSEDGTRRPMPFRRTAEGVAIVTLVGEWVNRGAWVGASSGLISYEGFKYQMQAAAADPRTTSILMDLESPGGEAVGAFEAAEVVRRVAKVKPVTALVNGMAASAAYAIASAATRIVSIPTGIAGSIGVVLCHLDISEYLKAEGIKPTLIHAGAHKVDANPYEPLPDSVRDDLQAEVEAFYGLFVQAVAAGRANLSDKAIRATQARCFMGEEALAAGLVDEISTFEDVLMDLSSAPGGASSKPKGTQMNFTQADLDKARAEGVAEGKKAGAADEKARVSAILGGEAAQGRASLASHLAFETDMNADQANGLLAKSAKEATEPKEEAPKGNAAKLAERMAAQQPLVLEPENPAAKEKKRSSLDAAGIYAARRGGGKTA